MPLPLAHPAAVLPLRRFCPKYLSFSALVIGSIVPDVAYAFNGHHSFPSIIKGVFGQAGLDGLAALKIHNWDGLSHSLLGSVVLNLPLGLVLIAAFRAARGAVVGTLPNPHRAVLTPMCNGGRQTLVVYSASLLIGVWSHLLWDSVAKDDWWLAKAWPVLQLQVVEAGTAHLELYQAIWMISSVGGSVVLLWAYLTFLKRNGRTFWAFERQDAPYYLVWLTAATLSGLIATVVSLRFWGFTTSASGLFHLFHAFYGLFLTAFGCCVVGIAIVAMLKRAAAGVPHRS